ncbi:MAG: hypothetical protein HYY17_05510 [Planctomycetes bacterium]|nr:hypothetical protein [Planctomycetota bacterium]
MTKSQAAALAILNVLVCVVTAAVSMQFSWKKWWLPLLLVGGACALASSVHLEFVQRRMDDSIEKRIVVWTGYALFAAGVLLAIGAFKL